MKIYKEELTDLIGMGWKIVFYDSKATKPEQLPQRLKDLLSKGYEVGLYMPKAYPLPKDKDYQGAVKEAFPEEPSFIFLQSAAAEYIKGLLKE